VKGDGGRGREEEKGGMDHEREGGRFKREELRGRSCESRLDRDPTEEIYIQ